MSLLREEIAFVSSFRILKNISLFFLCIGVQIIEKFRMAYRSFLERLRSFNLFDSNDARNDPYELRTSIISTRVYIILVCLFTVILIIYGSTNVRSQTFTLLKPSQTTFENLYLKYSSDVQCLCQQIAIQYDQFISLSPTYHPICTSILRLMHCYI